MRFCQLGNAYSSMLHYSRSLPMLSRYTNEQIEEIGMHLRPSSWMVNDCVSVAKRISKLYNTYNRYGDNCQLFVDRLWWLISQKTETHDIWKLVGAESVGTKADRLKLHRDYGFIMDQGATVAVDFNKPRRGARSYEQLKNILSLEDFPSLMITGIPGSH